LHQVADLRRGTTVFNYQARSWEPVRVELEGYREAIRIDEEPILESHWAVPELYFYGNAATEIAAELNLSACVRSRPPTSTMSISSAGNRGVNHMRVITSEEGPPCLAPTWPRPNTDDISKNRSNTVYDRRRRRHAPRM
jgi:hypothetical protein